MEVSPADSLVLVYAFGLVAVPTNSTGANANGLEKFFQENLARMDGRQFALGHGH